MHSITYENEGKFANKANIWIVLWCLTENQWLWCVHYYPIGILFFNYSVTLFLGGANKIVSNKKNTHLILTQLRLRPTGERILRIPFVMVVSGLKSGPGCTYLYALQKGTFFHPLLVKFAYRMKLHFYQHSINTPTLPSRECRRNSIFPAHLVPIEDSLQNENLWSRVLILPCDCAS